MKNISRLLALTVGSVLLVGCVDDGVYSTGSGYSPSRTYYRTHSAPPSGSNVTGTYSSSAAEPVSMPRSAVYQTGSRAAPVEGGSSVSGGYMTDAQ